MTYAIFCLPFPFLGLPTVRWRLTAYLSSTKIHNSQASGRSQGVSVHSLGISSGQVCGKEVLLCEHRLQRIDIDIDSSAQRLLPEPSSRAASTEPGVRSKPVRIVSGNVLIDHEMPLRVCDKAPPRPRERCLHSLVSFSHYIFEEPKATFSGMVSGNRDGASL